MKDDLELQLRAALKRQEPPPDFAARTIARASAETTRRPIRAGMPLAMAATLLITFAAAGIQHVQEQRRANDAKRQLMLALKITSEKLAVVEKVLDRSTN